MCEVRSKEEGGRTELVGLRVSARCPDSPGQVHPEMSPSRTATQYWHIGVTLFTDTFET